MCVFVLLGPTGPSGDESVPLLLQRELGGIGIKK